MRSDELLEIIGEAPDELIHDAKTRQGKEKPRLLKYLPSIAACLCLLVGGAYLFTHVGGNDGGSGLSGQQTYMSYEGPVLPLTVLENSEAITARRQIDFDFSPYLSREEPYTSLIDGSTTMLTRYDTEILITDSYELTNTGDTDQTLTLLYPFVGNLYEWEYHPILTSTNDSGTSLSLAPVLSGGQNFHYAEQLTGVEESDLRAPGGEPIGIFHGYELLLADGGYQAEALSPAILLDQPVTVYRLHDYIYSSDTTATNPSVGMTFHIDYEKTFLFTYGINGYFTREDGSRTLCNSAIVHRPDMEEPWQHPEDAYVILYGEDIDGYTIQGYRDGGCDDGEELNDLSCSVTRYETTLGEILAPLLAKSRDTMIRQKEPEINSPEQPPEPPPYELCYELTAKLLENRGALDLSSPFNHNVSSLADVFSSVFQRDRVLYLSCQITIPAGETVNFTAAMRKDGSCDYCGGPSEGQEGYDMATVLGSALTFAEQTASISGYNEIRIVAQNFGFDLESGITEVALDLSQPHYWMEVTKPTTK